VAAIARRSTATPTPSPLRRARLTRNWTLERVVEEMDRRARGGHSDVTATMVSGWELGRQTTSIGHRQTLCEIYRSSVDELFTHQDQDLDGNMTGTQISWHDAELVAIDLEGSGPQDRDQEAILEIATVPLDTGRPDIAHAYSTLINPGRTIRIGPWISPGLSNPILRQAPSMAAVEPHVAAAINGRYLIGHNIGVDWRLLQRHWPHLHPAGLLDTLRLARHLHRDGSRSLTSLLQRHALTQRVIQIAPGSQPHRALWDAVGAALLLTQLTTAGWSTPPTLGQLVTACAHRDRTTPTKSPQPGLF
jgi:DNA polymerase III subunit epsilon